jgi:hypothetical protein
MAKLADRNLIIFKVMLATVFNIAKNSVTEITSSKQAIKDSYPITGDFTIYRLLF